VAAGSIPAPVLLPAAAVVAARVVAAITGEEAVALVERLANAALTFLLRGPNPSPDAAKGSGAAVKTTMMIMHGSQAALQHRMAPGRARARTSGVVKRGTRRVLAKNLVFLRHKFKRNL